MNRGSPIPELMTRIADEQRCAYLALDDDGMLSTAGGDLAYYGLGPFELNTPVIDRLDFLRGIVPLDDVEYRNATRANLGKCERAMLYVIRESAITWVVLMDSTARHPGDVGDPAQTKAEALRAPIVDDNLGREIAAGLSEGMDSINREGERREVSVLFADLRGFTSFCDTNPVETIFPLLNQFLGTMIKTVTDHGGVVDKIIGDAVMAIFGLRATEDDNAKSQAVECGCEMIRLVFDISTRLPATQNNASRVLGLGVGIATGEVVVGVLGNDRRRSFTVIGHRVNLAARLESQARVGELLIDVETWEGIDPKSYEFELTDLWLKGITRAVPAMSVFPSVDGDPLE